MIQQSKIEVTGLSELNRALNELEDKLQGQLLRRAIHKGATIFRRAMRATVARSAGQAKHASSGSNRPHVADDIRIKAKRNSATGAVTATVGPSSKTAYIANFLEFGTSPHTIRAKGDKALYVPGIGFTKQVHHPGAPAKPFMRPAFDTKVQAAIDAIKTSLAKSIETLKGK